MQPISPVIPGVPEIVIAKDQPQYIPLPAIVTDQGVVISRWELDDEERQKIADGGCIYLQIHTFFQALQPLMISVDPPTVTVTPEEGDIQ